MDSYYSSLRPAVCTSFSPCPHPCCRLYPCPHPCPRPCLCSPTSVPHFRPCLPAAPLGAFRLNPSPHTVAMCGARNVLERSIGKRSARGERKDRGAEERGCEETMSEPLVDDWQLADFALSHHALSNHREKSDWLTPVDLKRYARMPVTSSMARHRKLDRLR